MCEKKFYLLPLSISPLPQNLGNFSAPIFSFSLFSFKTILAPSHFKEGPETIGPVQVQLLDSGILHL